MAKKNGMQTDLPQVADTAEWCYTADRQGNVFPPDPVVGPDMAEKPAIDAVEASGATVKRSRPFAASAQRAWYARARGSVREERPAPARLPEHERQWRALIAALLLLDGAAVWSSLALAFSLRMTTGLLGFYEASYDPAEYRLFMLLSIPLWLTVFALNGLYRRDNLIGGLAEYQYIFRSCVMGVVLLIVLSFFWRDYAMLSRGWLALALGLSLLLVTTERFLVRRAGYWGRRRGWLTARVLIIGANDQGVAMAKQWLASPTSGMHVVGFLDDFKPLGTPVIKELKVLGRASSLMEVARQMNVQDVVVVPTAVAWETFEKLVMRAPGGTPCTLRFSPGFYEILATGVAVTNKTFVPLYTLNEARLVGIEAVLKTVFDYGFTLHFLIYALPVMAMIAAALKVTAPDEPVLLRYLTVGERGRQFIMYKFRTWHYVRGQAVDAEVRAAAPVERVLYRTGLDKLPQTINVLQNQMSLVGPRPRVLAARQVGEAAVDQHAVRTLETVKPGITGAWAVARGSPDAAAETDTELRYVRNWTLWMDLQILFQSVRLWVYSGFWPGKVRDTRNGRDHVPSPRWAGHL